MIHIHSAHTEGIRYSLPWQWLPQIHPLGCFEDPRLKQCKREIRFLAKEANINKKL